MRIIEILQTVGICGSAILLALIAFMLFLLVSRLETLFMPFDLLDDEDDDYDYDDDEEEQRPRRRWDR